MVRACHDLILMSSSCSYMGRTLVIADPYNSSGLCIFCSSQASFQIGRWHVHVQIVNVRQLFLFWRDAAHRQSALWDAKQSWSLTGDEGMPVPLLSGQHWRYDEADVNAESKWSADIDGMCSYCCHGNINQPSLCRFLWSLLILWSCCLFFPLLCDFFDCFFFLLHFLTNHLAPMSKQQQQQLGKQKN